jgi:hypothetical protein
VLMFMFVVVAARRARFSVFVIMPA